MGKNLQPACICAKNRGQVDPGADFERLSLTICVESCVTSVVPPRSSQGEGSAPELLDGNLFGNRVVADVIN